MANSITPVQIPVTDSIDELRRSVEREINAISVKLNNQNFRVDIDANNHRIRNLRRPVEHNDAVTFGVLKDFVAKQLAANNRNRVVTTTSVSSATGAAGSDTQIQYNDSGVLGASAALTFLQDAGESSLRVLRTDAHARIYLDAGAGFAPSIQFRRTSDFNGMVIYRPPGTVDLRILDINTGADRFWFTNAGNLGIGVSPTQKLDVNGVANFRDHIRPETDSTINIGEGTTGNRFQWGFADVWNAEALEIENAAHNAHWAIKQQSGTSTILNFENTSSVAILKLRSASPTNFVQIPTTAALLFESTGGAPAPAIEDASTASDSILSIGGRLNPNVNLGWWIGSLDKRWDVYHGRQINLGTATGATSALVLFDGTSGRGKATFYSNTGSQITEVQIGANAADNLNDSLVIRNTAAAERVKAGVSSSGSTGAVAVFHASGNTITMIATGSASTEGFYVGVNRVVGAQGAAVANATDATTVIARLNDLLARLRTHGLIAT